MQDEPRNGAEMLIHTLLCNGISKIYGVPGEETTALMSAIAESEIDFVLCRNEQGAAFMASIYGRLAGRPAACLSTLGPGATNLVTGVADAQLDHVPMIAISGQGPSDSLDGEDHQIIDLASLFDPVTKSSQTLLDADSISPLVADAVQMACAEKPGAVHLSLPVDIAEATTSHDVVIAPQIDPSPADPAALDQAIARIGAAEKVVFLAGAGVLRAGAEGRLRKLAEQTQIPIVTSFMAKGILPRDHPQALFSIGQPAGDYIDLALHAADLIVAVGLDPVELSAEEVAQQADADLIVLENSVTWSDTPAAASVVVAGDLNHSLSRIGEGLSDRVWPEVPSFSSTRDGLISAFDRTWTMPDAESLAAPDICREVSQALREEDVVISGVGLHKLWIARHVIPKRPGQVIIPNGLAGMGLALPGAIAAAQLVDTGRVIALCGDGDLMMNLQEMETAARLALRLTVLVFEDGGYGLIDEYQSDQENAYAFGNPNWHDLAKAFGWSYAPVTRLAQLPERLDAALGAEGPTLLPVKVNYPASGGMPQARQVA